MNKRRGRPPLGTSRGRDRLLEAGTRLFTEHGYQGTSLRMLAEAADCDPALVAHHFGSKRGLFAQVTAVVLSPAEVVEQALPGPPELLGERLVNQVITAWEDPKTGPRLARLIHAALEDPRLLAALHEYVETEISQRLIEFFGGHRARDRTAAILTLIMGIIFGRYIIKTDALARLPAERYRHALIPQAIAAGQDRPRRSQ
ncbi:TetR/AcrR family transcriptional regulator [Actinobacteria bacterium YIM 96077]|uniref:TetR/AcrR family transcriptional regulator n=1 Tax=Phytoactinopolyspora halophila TaxID=1981511 RepID=A0A329QDX8_9ACTN|nr:TetR/AcrR family transcriptional regulator [Phytoactinopolyspora halophila]AYY15579.1 TetR/AcrR family transcriptional regulator [Actinobacteria bacterium YIM 96077]RAW09422.1 TetR/AcrR family transcriptional regulator [Phytoactinopolyspora halophila]